MYLEPCSRFSLTTTSFAMSLHAGMLASLTAEQVLLRTMLPMGRVMALASLMPCDEPEASTTTSKACRAAYFHPLLSFSTLIEHVFEVATADASSEVSPPQHQRPAGQPTSTHFYHSALSSSLYLMWQLLMHVQKWP